MCGNPKPLPIESEKIDLQPKVEEEVVEEEEETEVVSDIIE